MYQCEECGRTFEHPQKVKEIHRELDDNPAEIYYACPFCDSSNYSEVVQCVECEEFFEKDLKSTYIELPNSDVVCNDCLADYIRERI